MSHETISAGTLTAAGGVLATDGLAPLYRVSLGAPVTKSADVIGAATETVHGALTLTPAMTNEAGRVIKYRATLGCSGANSTDTWQIRVRLDGLTGVVLADSTAIDATVQDIVVIEGTFDIHAIGAATVAQGYGKSRMVGTNNYVTPIELLWGDGTNVTTTVNMDLVVTSTCSTNNAGNIWDLNSFSVEILPA